MGSKDKPETWYDLAARSPEERSKRPAPSPSLEQAKIQAQVLVPVLRAFREELGAERANKIAWGALAQWRQQVWRSMLVSPGTPTEQFRASTVALADIIGDAVDVEILKDEPESLEFNVTGCRYAQFFRELGEPELGFALTCSFDDTHLEVLGSDDVKLKRTGTIMNGADRCDFRYALKKAKRL